jgi:hypothetical protein
MTSVRVLSILELPWVSGIRERTQGYSDELISLSTRAR